MKINHRLSQFNLFGMLISFLIFSSCQTQEEVICVDQMIRYLTPKTESLTFFKSFDKKTIRFRDSMGEKLEFKVMAINTFAWEHFVEHPCFNDGQDLKGKHWTVYEPQIILESTEMLLEISLRLYLTRLSPEPLGVDLITFNLSDSVHRNNILELETHGATTLNNVFENQYVGTVTFNIRNNLGDPANLTFGEIWKTVYAIDNRLEFDVIDPRKNTRFPYHKTDKKINEEFFFNKKHGLVAFRLNDGRLWVLFE